MKAYRFLVKVSETGMIQIPYDLSLYNSEVEIIILPKAKPQEEKMKARDFVKKWAGFLSNSDTDQSKFDYLSDKYK